MADLRPPIVPQNAPKRLRHKLRRIGKKRAPFLPHETHPHGWLTRHSLKSHKAAGKAR